MTISLVVILGELKKKIWNVPLNSQQKCSGECGK